MYIHIVYNIYIYIWMHWHIIDMILDTCFSNLCIYYVNAYWHILYCFCWHLCFYSVASSFGESLDILKIDVSRVDHAWLIMGQLLQNDITVNDPLMLINSWRSLSPWMFPFESQTVHFEEPSTKPQIWFSKNFLRSKIKKCCVDTGFKKWKVKWKPVGIFHDFVGILHDLFLFATLKKHPLTCHMFSLCYVDMSYVLGGCQKVL